MAKFNPGIVTNISGSMGGTSFVDSPYGPYMRQLTIPVNHWSESKQKSKQNQTNVTRLWAQLNPKQVEGWIKLAAKMPRINSSGVIVQRRAIDLFKHVNRNFIEIGELPVLDAPRKVFPKQFNSIDVKIIASKTIDDIRVFFNPAIPENTKFIIYASSGLKPGVQSSKKHFYKKVAVIDSTFISGSSIFDRYISVFKYYPISFKIAFKFKPVSRISGLTAEPVSFIRIPD